MERDPSLDHLLGLDGTHAVIDETGYWVKFRVARVVSTPERPHGLSYSLTLHSPDNVRVAGFDNAHPPLAPRGRSRTRLAHDHRHRFRTVSAYDYNDAEALLGDFWALVESVMRDLGVWK